MFYSKGENRRKSWFRMLSVGRKKLLALGCVIALFFFVFLGVVVVYMMRASEFDLALVARPAGGGMLYDAENKPVAALNDNAPIPVVYEDLPQPLIEAFLSREDEHFFEHGGVVYSAFVRSAVRNITSMSYEQGGSTITMQLARNVYDLQDKTMDRKILEVFLTRRIERTYDKQTILTQYLNRIYFGQGCYGIGTAAQFYFGKKVADLDLGECATLAGLVRGPSIFNPVDSMSSAVKVRNETLDRMLKLEYITQEQRDAAAAAPIELKPSADREVEENSYPTMWVKREMDSLRGELGQAADGASVVSTLCMPVQLHLEDSVERALQAVEVPGNFPEEWNAFLPEGQEAAEYLKKSFMKARRPKELKVRGAENNLQGMLQCCVLVVDMRPKCQGNILAVVSGRSVVDGVDRWQGKVEPGRVSAPLVFCCACLPGAEDQHIVSDNAETTGSRLGYDVVHAFISSLGLEADLPPAGEASRLYNGLYPMRRLDLARVLFSLRNMGRGYKLSMVSSVWNSANHAVYVREPEKAPEYIRRESARSVASVEPFICTEGKPAVLSERLPDNNGVWTMVCNDRGLAVFVWMGFDEPDNPAAASGKLVDLMTKASLYLARETHAFTREYLRGAKSKDSSKK